MDANSHYSLVSCYLPVLLLEKDQHIYCALQLFNNEGRHYLLPIHDSEQSSKLKIANPTIHPDIDLALGTFVIPDPHPSHGGNLTQTICRRMLL